jgi:hypothetical protein
MSSKGRLHPALSTAADMDTEMDIPSKLGSLLLGEDSRVTDQAYVEELGSDGAKNVKFMADMIQIRPKP